MTEEPIEEEAQRVFDALDAVEEMDDPVARARVIGRLLKDHAGRNKRYTEYRRLETGGLIVATGETNGRTIWKLALHLKRPESDWSDLERLEEDERKAAAERKRRSRSKQVTHSASVTVTDSASVTDEGGTHSASGSHAFEVRDVTHSASGRHALNAALTTNEPSVQPPTTDRADVGGHTSGPWGPPQNAPIDDDGFALTDSMRRWALDTFGPAIDVDHETALFVDHHRANYSRRPNWPAEWQKWIRRSAKWAAERATRPPLRAVSGGYQPWTNPQDQSLYERGF